ncbi:MAG: hypothetical protein FWE09_00370 [Treponema sp.]|nr:hypothetical protein [Treponema sp.]
MSERKPRWEGEMWATTQPNARACATCAHRPSEYDGETLDRADTDNCRIFRSPESKPDDVYWRGADCKHYMEAQ